MSRTITKFIVFFFAFGTVLLSAKLLKAEGLGGERGATSSAYDTMNSVKEEISQLLEENQILDEQYRLLQNKYYQLQAQYEERKKTLDQAALEREQFMEKKQDQNEFLRELDQEFNDLHNKLLVQESKHNLQSGGLLDSGEKQKLWQLELADLEYQKRELELIYKYKRALQEQQERKDRKEISAMKRSIKKKLEQEKIVSSQIERLESEGGMLEKKIAQLRVENEQIKNAAEQLSVEKEFKSKELATLADKRLYAIKSSEFALADRQDQEQKLKARYQQLEQEYALLNSQVQDSLTRQEDRQTITEDMIKVDQENQMLREKITSLQEKIKSLE